LFSKLAGYPILYDPYITIPGTFEIVEEADRLHLSGNSAAAHVLHLQVKSIVDTIHDSLMAMPEAERDKAQVRQISLDQASALGSLGVSFVHLGDYTSARPLLERSLAIRQQYLPPTNVMIGCSLASLGHVLSRQGLHDKGDPMLQRALELQELAMGKEHQSVAMALSQLARSKMDQGHFKKAKTLLLRAVSIEEKMMAKGGSAVGVSSCVANLATIYRELGDALSAHTAYDVMSQ
jgi:tetratricopeptide (TPR) repeat protein